MLLRTKGERLKFLEGLQVGQRTLIGIYFDGEREPIKSTAELEWVTSRFEYGWEKEIHLATFPLFVIVPTHSKIQVDIDNKKGYVKEFADKTFCGYPQNLIDNYIWEINDNQISTAEYVEISKYKEIKSEAISALRKGIAPKKSE